MRDSDNYDDNVHVIVTHATVQGSGNFDYESTTTITPEGTTRSTREVQRNPGYGGPSESTGGGHSSGSRYEPYAPTEVIDADSDPRDAVAHLRSSGGNRRRNR